MEHNLFLYYLFNNFKLHLNNGHKNIMRGTKYLETDITRAYGNKKAFDIHQVKLRDIQG